MSIPENLNFDKHTNLEAVARLVVILENTPDDNFNIGSWSCGTAHCAVGLAACDPWFNQHGLYLDDDGVVCFKRPDSDYPPNPHWQAVSKMFKIDYHESEWLFSGQEYLSEYPEQKLTIKERARINTIEDDETQNILFQHIPKSAVIDRLKQVLELNNYEIR